MDKCIKCNSTLTAYDIGATKKFINRGAVEYMCIECLAKKFGVSVELIMQTIERFKRDGCVLFPND